jgi:hypothetical protein
MKSTHVLSVTCRPDLRVRLLSTTIVALCAVFVVCPVLAQDAATAGGDVAPAGGPGDGSAMKGPAGGAEAPAVANHGIDPVTPQRGSAGLQRRANLKALISSAPHQAAGLPAANTRVAPLLMSRGIGGATPRNPIGAAMPGARPADRDVARTMTEAGTRLTGLGATGRVGTTTHQIPVPTNVGPAMHGVGINGTTMGHMASGPASIEGPAKDRSGINGTLMRPTH